MGVCGVDAPFVGIGQALTMPFEQPVKNKAVLAPGQSVGKQCSAVMPRYLSPLPLPWRYLVLQVPVVRSVMLMAPSLEPVTSQESTQSNAVTCPSSRPCRARKERNNKC